MVLKFFFVGIFFCVLFWGFFWGGDGWFFLVLFWGLFVYLFRGFFVVLGSLSLPAQFKVKHLTFIVFASIEIYKVLII